MNSKLANKGRGNKEKSQKGFLLRKESQHKQKIRWKLVAIFGLAKISKFQTIDTAAKCGTIRAELQNVLAS